MSSVIVERLIKSNYDLKDWLLTETPRLTGLLVFMRDDYYKKLTKKQIIQEITNYFDKSIKDLEQDITNSNNFLKHKDQFPNSLVSEYESKKYNLEIEINKEREDWEQKKAKLIKSIDEFKTLLSKNPSELIIGALEGSLRYLESAYNWSYDREFNDGYIETIPDTYEKYLNLLVLGHQDTIERARKEIKATRKRKQEYLDFYQEYTKFIEDNI